MRRLYIFVFIFIVVTISSQNVTFTVNSTSTGNSPVVNNDVFYRTTTASSNIKHYFEIKNTSAASQTFSVRRYDDLLNVVTAVTDEASAYFCTGLTCYPASITDGTFVLGAGQNISLTTDLDEASVVGQSNIRYFISNFNAPSDALTVSIQYNGPLSVKESLSYFTNSSGAYPNPATSKVFIDVNAGMDLNNVQVNVLNLLGAAVSSKQINLDKGKNKIAIETENLESGIYFVAVIKGNSRITKKITLNK